MVSDALDRAKAAAARLKVFPLPSVALLPGMALPLHIFEQRYRDMVRDALATDRIFAMAHVVPGQEPLLEGKPELESMLCIGSMGLCDLTDDGRYNVVLIGVARARMIRELPSSEAYRVVEATVLDDDEIEDADEAPLRHALFEMIARVPRPLGEQLAQVTSRVRGGLLADVVAGIVMNTVVDRFELLNDTDARRRIQTVTHEVIEATGRMKPLKPDPMMN